MLLVVDVRLKLLDAETLLCDESVMLDEQVMETVGAEIVAPRATAPFGAARVIELPAV